MTKTAPQFFLFGAASGEAMRRATEAEIAAALNERDGVIEVDGRDCFVAELDAHGDYAGECLAAEVAR